MDQEPLDGCRESLDETGLHVVGTWGLAIGLVQGGLQVLQGVLLDLCSGPDAHIWLSPKVRGSARLDDYRPIALGQLDMKLLTGPLTQRITEVLTRHGVVSDWQQGALPGSNTGPPLFMAQRQLQRGRSNYIFSFNARKAFHDAPHGAHHLILRQLPVPRAVIHLLLFLHTCARLRIVTAHGLTLPVHMLCGVLQGNLESSLLYALLLEPLLRAQGHRLRPPGGAEQGLIQVYIDDLLVVAHTLQHFVESVEAVAACLGMVGMSSTPASGPWPHRGSPACSCASVPTWKTHGTGYQRRTPSPTWDSSRSRTGSSPCSASTSYA